MANEQRIIYLEEGWNEIKERGIDPIANALNSGIRVGDVIKPKEYVAIHNICYDMCTQCMPHNWTDQLYQRHGETIEKYLTDTVLPALRDTTGRGGTILLTELQHQWTNHQIMNKWLKKFFTYLDRYHVKHLSLPTLSQVGLNCFRTKIYDEMKTGTTTAILDLINDEREGVIIDKTLVKSTVKLYEAMGMESLDAYNADLEEPLLNSTLEYYRRKREEWINEDSSPEYLITKAEDALNKERARVADYLNASTEAKFLKVVEEELLERGDQSVANHVASVSHFETLYLGYTT